jgi:5-formyltetrahydrofolate cyclo-ligase
VTTSPASAGKTDLRRLFLQRRLALGREVSALSVMVQERLLDQAVFVAARSIMVYVAFRGEVSTERIIEVALESGKIVSAPVTLPAERRLLPFRLSGSSETLRRGAYGIAEPDPLRSEPFPAGGLDLVIVPGVAFDLAGGRLGYGGGYYDRFLAGEAIQAARIGLAFETQVSTEPLPLDGNDMRMDWVYTEKRILRGVNREDETAPGQGAWDNG